MNEALLNAAGTQSSTGTGWFGSLFNTAANLGQSYLNSRTPAAGAAAPATSAPMNWTPVLYIGGAVAVLLVLVFAFKK